MNNQHLESNIDILDTNTRVIWEFTLGIPINDNDNNVNNVNNVNNEFIEVQNNIINDAVYEITEELTQITEGLTYEYCYGTWLKTKNYNTELNLVERDRSVRISVIVLPEIAEQVYNSVKQIISKANAKYKLGIVYVQAMKSFGSARHFCVN